jgi:hypothetical protein
VQLHEFLTTALIEVGGRVHSVADLLLVPIRQAGGQS